MTFTLDTWRTQTRKQLESVGKWLTRGQRSKLPHVIYSTVSGLTVWPLVKRAVETDQVASIIAVLYSVVAREGSSLLAHQIETWKNQTEPPTEIEVIIWISQHISTNIELRQTLDDILQTLSALHTAQSSLPEKYHEGFEKFLKSELNQLGNSVYFEAYLSGNGALAQGNESTAVGKRGALAQGNVSGSMITGDVAAGQDIVGRDNIKVRADAVYIGHQPERDQLFDEDTALGRYLSYVVAHTRYLQLQGVRSRGRLVHIELAQIYITLRATQQRTGWSEKRWLANEAQLAPGERYRTRKTVNDTVTKTMIVSVNKALSTHSRLVVLGDPGSGKTTLLRYLALLYARDLQEREVDLVQDILELDETGLLPIFLRLRQVGAFLKKHAEESTEGHRLLLNFLQQHLKNERIDVPLDFFDSYLADGRAVILLDGMDEVSGTDLRRRVARLVEAFTRAYPDCRFVVTSRIVGYEGPARLGEGYATTTVQDFTLADVEKFLSYWHRLVAISQMGLGRPAEHAAQRQTQQLLDTIRNNERIRELAINPLLLTVIALVHRDRVKLPDRRAELYAEAVDVLLGKWDQARGVTMVQSILPDRPFDTTDRRLLLQRVALYMHEHGQKEIGIEVLQALLRHLFQPLVADKGGIDKAVRRFLRLIEARTGLLVARGDGVYTFSHLTFQEYLAALAVAARDDYVDYTLARSGDGWWREVILLEAGHLSLLSKERTTRLVAGIAEHKKEPTRYHNLVLASECLRDVGEGRVDREVADSIARQLREGLKETPSRWVSWLKGKDRAVSEWITLRSNIAIALIQAGGGYWTQPYGEPEWVKIPAGKFVMGSRQGSPHDKSIHRVSLPGYAIARTPITNAQYQLFVKATSHPPPENWQGNRSPKGLGSHPVTYVTWHDAVAYCRWLSRVTGKYITLPSEAEWEKAARGKEDRREYPWGDDFDHLRCNNRELELGTTTPVGIFPNGMSTYGVLDMSGNVWEWTRSVYKSYPYRPDDGRESMQPDKPLVLRGGSWKDSGSITFRNEGFPAWRTDSYGFRVVHIVR